MGRLEIVRQDDRVTVLKGMATVFGSPERRDLSGEFFDENTWFGDELGIDKKFAIYDHAINDLQNPFAEEGAPPDPIIGVAKFIEKDARGRWFEFEIQRANEYHDFVMALHAMNRLGTSSRTLPGKGVKELDPQVKGRIAKWPEVEVTLTPTPCDDATAFTEEDVIAVVGAMKTYAPKLHEQWQALLLKNAQNDADKKNQEEPDQTPPADSTTEPTADAETAPVDPLQAAVNELLNDAPVDPPALDESENPPASDISDLLPSAEVVALQAQVAALETRLAAAEEAAAGVKALTETVNALQAHLTTVVGEAKTLKAKVATQEAELKVVKAGKITDWARDKSVLELVAMGLPELKKSYTPPPVPDNQQQYLPVIKSAFGPEAPGS